MQVLCKLSAATGVGSEVIITVKKMVQTMFQILSYDKPKILEFSPKNLEHSESCIMKISGANFGDSGNAATSIRIGDSDCPKTTWTSETSISCTPAPGFASNLNVIVTVNNIEASRSGFSYDNPEVRFRLCVFFVTVVVN